MSEWPSGDRWLSQSQLQFSDSLLPSCIPSLLSSRDVIVAEGYSGSFSSKRVTGGEEPGRALFLEVMLPFRKCSRSQRQTGGRGGGETHHRRGRRWQMGRQHNDSRVSLHRCYIMNTHTHTPWGPSSVPFPSPCPCLSLLLWSSPSAVTSSTEQTRVWHRLDSNLLPAASARLFILHLRL